jgi:hypothetical protein
MTEPIRIDGRLITPRESNSGNLTPRFRPTFRRSVASKHTDFCHAGSNSTLSHNASASSDLHRGFNLSLNEARSTRARSTECLTWKRCCVEGVTPTTAHLQLVRYGEHVHQIDSGVSVLADVGGQLAVYREDLRVASTCE